MFVGWCSRKFSIVCFAGIVMGYLNRGAKNVRIVHIDPHIQFVSDVHFVIGKSGISLHKRLVFHVNGR
jgi:hypothetical protein